MKQTPCRFAKSAAASALRRITATTDDFGVLYRPGPDLTSHTSPHPMIPHLTSASGMVVDPKTCATSSGVSQLTTNAQIVNLWSYVSTVLPAIWHRTTSFDAPLSFPPMASLAHSVLWHTSRWPTLNRQSPHRHCDGSSRPTKANKTRFS